MNSNEPSAKPTTIAFGQVAEDRQQEGREQHHRIAARRAQQRREGMLLRHVPGDDRQHAGERRQRDVARQRRRHQHEQRAGRAECSMPGTGPCAPARTLVAVRAMVPVTQMPPNSAEPILATPCATSSQFERCRRPVMPSATTAESSDSIAPSSAKAIASGSTACSLPRLTAGSAGSGSRRGMPPKRVPMVSTGSPSSPGRQRGDARPRSACPASAAAAASAPTIPATVATASATVAGSAVGSAGPERRQLRQERPGLGPRERQPEQLLDLAREDDRPRCRR